MLVRDARSLEGTLELLRLGSWIQDDSPRCQIDDVLDHPPAACGSDVQGESVDRFLDPVWIIDHRDLIDMAYLRVHRNHIVAMCMQPHHRLVGITDWLRACPQDNDSLLFRVGVVLV